MNSSTVDWATIRLQYEMFGAELPDLADEYDVSLTALEYAAEEQRWHRVQVAEAARQDWRDLDQLKDVGEGLIDDVQKRIRILQTVKESALSPRYIMLETAILGKARDIITAIRPDAPLAGQQLKQVSEVLEKMRSQNEALRPTPQDNGSGGGGGALRIQIIGRVNPDGTPQIGAQVEIAHRADNLLAPAGSDEIGLDCSPQKQAILEG